MKHALILLFFLLTGLVFSQSKKVWVYNADNFYEKEDYYNALLYYQKALDDSMALIEMVKPYQVEITNQKIDKKKFQKDSTRQVPMTDYIRHQIGMCYLLTNDYNHAVDHFARTSRDHYPEDQYYYATALMNVKSYDKAINEFENYIRSEKYADSLLRSAQLSMTGCYYALNENNFNSEVDVQLLDTTIFNKGTSSFGVRYFKNENGIMFTSARKGGIILEPDQQSEFLCDIYYSLKNENGEWDKATNFGRPLNSAIHDAAASMNNNNVIFYNRWSDQNKKEQHIHLARMVDFKFYESYKLPENVNVPGYKSIQPFISMDGRTLYFSSNRPGGLGGMDLWKIEIDELGNPVGEAENLGYPVNSELDEVTAFFHEASSTLFFSSNGHNSIGGLDVFKSSYNRENKAYMTPENLGMPINSSKDDAYLIWDSKLKKGFLSSDREPCESGHCYNIYEITNSPIKIMLSGISYNMETNEILPNTNLTFKDIDGEFKPFTIVTDEKGYYEKELEQGQEIFIKAQKNGFFADAASVNTKFITQSMHLRQNFYLNPIPGDEIDIEGIEYDFDSDKLRPISMEILDKIYDFLILNNNLVVEINSHTDARGSDIYNQDLSQRRAKSCVDYLISKGIDKDRLIAKGYGESQPHFLAGPDKKPVLNENGQRILLTEEYINKHSSKDKREELHQRNRRTSFKVVGEKFDLQSR
jgi:OmpA-OmpF porin, OOP family